MTRFFHSATIATSLLAVAFCWLGPHAPRASADEFDRQIRPLLQEYCIDCHSSDDPSGGADLTSLQSTSDVEVRFETWETAVQKLRDGTMPPDDASRPSPQERDALLQWHQRFVDAIEVRPAVMRPRRLAVHEYRNSLRSVLGFDLEVDVIEAEQTVTERSMVIKLLPTDPPGESGFTNDTHRNRLSTNIWDQYTYLVDAALEELLSPDRAAELGSLIGSQPVEPLTTDDAHRMIREVMRRAFRRPVDEGELDDLIADLPNQNSSSLRDELIARLKSILMSPRFLYVGLMTPGEPGQRRPLSTFELAERLSYFLWADMPDDRLWESAVDGSLKEREGLAAQIDRMLDSPKSRSLAEDFASQWLTLGEIEHVSDNPPHMVALQSQVIDFLNFMFTENRTLMELIDSDVEFVNVHTARYYRPDSKQLTKYAKRRGIEVEIVSNQRIELIANRERGGVLTMPGVLAMNKGPIQRGTWVLERILGQELPEPPATVGQVEPNRPGQELTFRQRFEQHRSDASCAGCHDQIDPLGFAFQAFDVDGHYIRGANYSPGKKLKKQGLVADPAKIDTSGQMPSGESFADVTDLKRILAGSHREHVIRNLVERTMSYALARKLHFYDRPAVDTIVQQMMATDATWRDLFHAVVGSVPFRETIVAGE